MNSAPPPVGTLGATDLTLICGQLVYPLRFTSPVGIGTDSICPKGPKFGEKHLSSPVSVFLIHTTSPSP